MSCTNCSNSCSSSCQCTTTCTQVTRYQGPELTNLNVKPGTTYDNVIQNISNFLTSSGSTSSITVNSDGTYTHNNGLGTTVTLDWRDKIPSWVASTAYVQLAEVTAMSPTTGHQTLYRRKTAGTSTATFNAAEEANWETVATLGRDRLHGSSTAVTVATAGQPTEAEIATFATAQNFRDGLIYYTGTTSATDVPTYIFWVDQSGNVTMIEKPATTVTNKKFAADITLTANTALSVNHNLATTDLIVQLKDSTGKLVIPDVVNNYVSNSVNITTAVSGTYRVMIVGI